VRVEPLFKYGTVGMGTEILRYKKIVKRVEFVGQIRSRICRFYKDKIVENNNPRSLFCTRRQ